MGVQEPAGQTPGQFREQVKVTQAVQEAHKRVTTDLSQQSGPAYPFPTALSELGCTLQDPKRSRCNPEIPPGELGVTGQGWAWGSLSQGEGHGGEGRRGL